MTPTKACPVVLRGEGTATEILAFVHPLAGRQLVKGTIEPGESPAQAALRELAEEAGLQATVAAGALGDWPSGFRGQVWSFQRVHCVGPMPDGWTHACADDGGHVFRFFWHRLHGAPGADWHGVYVDALRFLRDALGPQRVAR
ncbi:NUDIX hydrolase [Aquabacterium humicola]|uniref:NUDIX hydrolase n=1 Tax=Aquabacterium humicola TaxID=3237377 RepID=UPI0025428ABB|nr:NUDIX domain-containing protein [Rubrivivax pictus]